MFFVLAKKRKNEKSLQRNVLNTNVLVNMIKKVIGPHKSINVLTDMKTYIPLRGPFKNLNCLDDTKTSFLRPFKLFIFLRKDFARTKSTKSTKSIKAKPSKSTKHK